MNYWVENHFFKIWNQMQERMFKILSTTVTNLDQMEDADFLRQPQMKSMAAWGEAAIRQTLDMQSSWLKQWYLKIDFDELNRSDIDRLTVEANENMKKWTEAQLEIWDSWFDALNHDDNVSELSGSFCDTIRTWEVAVKQTLTDQSKLFDQWRQQVQYDPLSSTAFEHFAQHLTESMQSWISAQNQLWDYWFNLFGVDLEQPSPFKESFPVRAVSQRRDDLKLIAGIGPGLEKKLNSKGIFTYQQIADLNPDDIARLEKSIIRFPGRIVREDWVGQAKELARQDDN